MLMNKKILTVVLLSIIMLISLLSFGYAAKAIPGDTITLTDIYAKLEDVLAHVIQTDLKVDAVVVSTSEINNNLAGTSKVISEIDLNLDGLIINFGGLGTQLDQILTKVNTIDYSDEFTDTYTKLGLIQSGIDVIISKIDYLSMQDPINDDVDGIPDPVQCEVSLDYPIFKNEPFRVRTVLADANGTLITNVDAMDFTLSTGEILSVNWSDSDGAYIINTRISRVGNYQFQVYVNRVLVNLVPIPIEVTDKSLPSLVNCTVSQVVPVSLPYELNMSSNIVALRAEILNFSREPIRNLTAADFELSNGEIINVIEHEADYELSTPYYHILVRMDHPGEYVLQMYVQKVLVKDRLIIHCPDSMKPSSMNSTLSVSFIESVAGQPFGFIVKLVNADNMPINNLQPYEFKLSYGEILTVEQLPFSNPLDQSAGQYKISARIYALGEHQIDIYANYVKLAYPVLVRIN